MSQIPSLARIDYVSSPAGPLTGDLSVPGDKSISHRAVMLGAIADGNTRIKRILKSADTIATVNVFRDMGVQIDEIDNEMIVHGVGYSGLKEALKPLYFGNSGTSVRLMTGILAGQKFDSILTGDESLSKRPMQRIAIPLTKMGADVEYSETGTLPLTIKGNRKLKAISYELPVASAQLKSCLLLAGLYADGNLEIIVPIVTRDHTERMLRCFGANLTYHDNSIKLAPCPLRGTQIDIPGDLSSAAFFIVAATINPGSDIVLNNIGVNPTRRAVIDILILMGANISVDVLDDSSDEPVANIHVRSSELKGIEIPTELVSIAIDEFPCIMIAAAYAKGKTNLRNATELRVKESDRIDAIADGLERIGIEVSTREDGITVKGGPVRGGEVESYGDHRIAMAFTVAAIGAEKPIKINDCINVNTSFPDFVKIAGSIGLNIEIQETNV